MLSNLSNEGNLRYHAGMMVAADVHRALSLAIVCIKLSDS